jgi:hypothetical protein
MCIGVYAFLPSPLVGEPEASPVIESWVWVWGHNFIPHQVSIFTGSFTLRKAHITTMTMPADMTMNGIVGFVS